MYAFFKEVYDRLVALSLLVLLSPFLVILSVAIALTMGWPVLFKQKRVGRHGARFILIKFRTMLKETTELSDNERLTSFGKTLRKFSLDELPQLLNVLKGDMSLVGPRPLLVEYLPLYSKKQSRRHEVKPGITGWAQVNGRNAISWEEKFDLDVWYVDHCSFRVDFKILLKTAMKLFSNNDVYSKDSQIMKRFEGSDE